MMSSTLVHRPYMAVATTTDAERPQARHKRYPRPHQQHNWKPVPLRLPFLASFVLVFAGCIVLIELVLRNSIGTSTNPSVDVITTSTAVVRHRARRHESTTSLKARQVETTNCDNTATLTARMSSSKAASSSLCGVFTESYKAHTANLSWPLQTEVSQWLLQYESASKGYNSVTASDHYCSSEAGLTSYSYTGAFGTFTRTFDVLCTVTIITFDFNLCQGQGTAWISNFALSSTFQPVCGIQTSQVIVETSKPVSTMPTEAVIVEVAPTSASPSVTATLPTVTKPASSGAKASPAVVTSTLPAATSNSAHVPTQSISEPNGNGDETMIIALAPVTATYTTTNAAGQAQTIVTQVNQVAAAGTAASSTITATNSRGQPETIVVAAATQIAAPTTVVVTNVAGALETITTKAYAEPSATVVLTNSQGQVETLVVAAATQIAAPTTVVVTNVAGVLETITTEAYAEPSATAVLTNSQGQVETLIVAANALLPTMSAYVITKPNGEVQTTTTQVYALEGFLTTYATTNDAGQIQTVVSAFSPPVEFTTTSQYTSLITTTYADGSVSTFSAVVVETVVLTSTPAAGTVLATKTSTASSKATATPFSLSSNEQIVDHTYTRTSYIGAMYLPALIAVLAKIMWDMVFAAVKLIQPFERMATGMNIDAKYSIFSEYLSSGMSLDAFASLGHGNPLPLLAGMLYVLVQVGAPVAAASMTIRSRSTCIIDGQERRCDPVWVINVPMLRAVEGALGVALVIILLVIWSTWKLRSGVSSDPSSLASLAALMTYEPLVRDIHKIGPDAEHEVYEVSLNHHRFMLDYHDSASGQHTHGIIGLKDGNVSGATQRLSELDSSASTAYLGDFSSSRRNHDYHSVHNPSGKSSWHTTSTISRLRNHLVGDVFGLLVPLTIFTLVLTFYLDNNVTDLINRFFLSNTPAPKFLLVGLATLSSLHLNHLERLVRIAEPFRRLSANAPPNGSVPPATTLMISRSGTSFSNVPQCSFLFARHEVHGGRMFFQLLLTLTAIASDVNIIAVAGVPLSNATIWDAYQASCKTSLAISAWIVLVYGVVLLWWRRSAAIRHVGGRSISRGCGTIAGCMRWLACGHGDSGDVIEAVNRIREEQETRRMWKGNGRSSDEKERGGMLGEIRVWFGRTGSQGLNGQERWAMMCDLPLSGRHSVIDNMRERRRSEALGSDGWF